MNFVKESDNCSHNFCASHNIRILLCVSRLLFIAKHIELPALLSNIMLSAPRVFVISVFVRIVYSEWIEIAQSVHSLNEAANNRSLVTTNENSFDFSTYKDFFSIIEPDRELVKNLTIVQKNSIFSNKLSGQNDDSDFHMIMVNPTEENHLLVHPSNVSTLIDEMMDTHEIQSQNVKEKPSDETSSNSMNKSQSEKSEQNSKNTKADTITFKRLEFKPLDFNNILKFLTNMQQSFAINSLTGIGDKVKFLVQFKENLLENIGKVIEVPFSTERILIGSHFSKSIGRRSSQIVMAIESGKSGESSHASIAQRP